MSVSLGQKSGSINEVTVKRGSTVLPPKHWKHQFALENIQCKHTSDHALLTVKCIYRNSTLLSRWKLIKEISRHNEFAKLIFPVFFLRQSVNFSSDEGKEHEASASHTCYGARLY